MKWNEYFKYDDGKKLYLGLFKTAEEAAECVAEHTRRLYGEFTPS